MALTTSQMLIKRELVTRKIKENIQKEAQKNQWKGTNKCKRHRREHEEF